MSLRPSIQGHWARVWIKAPAFEDHTTRVHWAQVGPDYADVRIPFERPDISQVAALSDLPPEALAALAEAEGFAGQVTLDGTQCTWHREINFHGTPDTADVGTIRFDADGHMIEEGVHADYTELWAQAPGSAPMQALRLSGGGYAGHVVTVGDACVIGIGRSDKPTTAPLIETLKAGHIPDGAAALFDGLHALGRWQDGALVADLATQPFAEGQTVLSRRNGALVWHDIAFDGTRRDVVLEMETLPA